MNTSSGEETGPKPKKFSPKFPLGRVCATSNAVHTLPEDDIALALSRHVAADWGSLDPEDWLANERAFEAGDRLFSRYFSKTGVKFYVITEWDRSATTVLLPEDY